MKVIVTGAGGQLGRELLRRAPADWEVFGLGRAELEITDAEQARQVVREIHPDVIIHAAAYTAVDRAEEEPKQAFAVNAYGARNIAVEAEEIGARLCYISTDYVFDGEAERPYREYDPTGPNTVYGQSKLAGEQMVTALTRRHFIVRTSWLYGAHGQNFVKTMLRLAEEGRQPRVVNDQTGSPTYAADLADFLIRLVATNSYGIYHASNAGQCTWYEFARAIFEEALASVRALPCRTEEYPRPAPRPRYSVLDSLAMRCSGFGELRPWREALRAFLRGLP